MVKLLWLLLTVVAAIPGIIFFIRGLPPFVGGLQDRGKPGYHISLTVGLLYLLIGFALLVFSLWPLGHAVG